LRCEICGRETGENAYCTLHAGAYQQIVKMHDRWKEALEITWKDYLSEIAKNPLTGEWAKEVAEQLIRLEKK
jgi:hypothetical protein